MTDSSLSLHGYMPTTLQSQNTVSAYFTSKQILYFGFACQHGFYNLAN